jgi:hypothetical protein
MKGQGKMKKKVELMFVLDETGSMEDIRTDTIGSFNTFVEEQKALDADVTFSLILFSMVGDEDTYRSRYKSVPLSNVEPLTVETYRPRGVTPLLDAVGGTVDSLGTRLADMPEQDRPNQVIVVILTDGLENASTEYTIQQVREKVQHQQDVYKWEFIFLGCGIDAFNAATCMGIPGAAASSYTRDAQGVRAAYQTASSSISHSVSKSSGDPA